MKSPKHSRVSPKRQNRQTLPPTTPRNSLVPWSCSAAAQDVATFMSGARVRVGFALFSFPCCVTDCPDFAPTCDITGCYGAAEIPPTMGPVRDQTLVLRDLWPSACEPGGLTHIRGPQLSQPPGKQSSSRVAPCSVQTCVCGEAGRFG